MSMTTEEKAKVYAGELRVSTAIPGVVIPMIADMVEAAYLAGATEALASQWVSVEVRLPEDNTLVVVWINSTILTDYCESGEWHYHGVRFWLPIPPLKGGDA